MSPGGLFTGLLVREAIASVSIEHAGGCGCDICLAAKGDTDAFARVWAATQDQLQKEDGCSTSSTSTEP